MARFVQLDLFAGAAVAAPAVVEACASPVVACAQVECASDKEIAPVGDCPDSKDFFFYDDYYFAAIRAGIVQELPKSDWCSGCRLRMVCDRDMCARYSSDL